MVSGYYRDKNKEYKSMKKDFNYINETVNEVLQYPFVAVPERGLKKETLEYFGCRVRLTETAPQMVSAMYFPAYSKDGKKITGYQKKDFTIPKEDPGHFTAIGSVRNTCMLYGQKQCQHGGKKLFLTEGWLDMMSAFQALKDISIKNGYGHINPSVCSIVNGTSNSDKSVAHNEDFVKSFGQVIIAMDNDSRKSVEPENIIRGKEATDLIGSYLSSNNLFVPNYPENRNDLNEILCEDGAKALNDLLLWNVKPFQAEKIITFDEAITFEEAIAPVEKGIMFDNFPKFNEALLGLRPHELTTITGLSGTGKCHGPGTKILMIDGSLKNVEDIVIGDKVLGTDGYPRTVLKTHCGFGKMYRVEQVDGIPYTVNEEHLLSLKVRQDLKEKGWVKNDIINISVKDYIELIGYHKAITKGWKPKEIAFNPWVSVWEPWAVGNWLADGTLTKPNITFHKNDTEILEEWYRVSERNDYYLRETNYEAKRNSCGLQIAILRGFSRKLQDIGILHNKRIPKEYLFSNREDRIELLSGLLDGDGYLTNKTYEIAFKSDELCNDVAFIARSLGLRVSIVDKFSKCQGFEGRYYKRMHISGDTDILNLRLKRKIAGERRQIKDWSVTGIIVNQIDDGEYYGFELDGDHLYLLEDFTVCHNSSFAFELCYQCVLQGHKVGLIMLEDPLQKTQQRISARYLKVNPREYFINPRGCGKSEEALKEAWNFSINPDNFIVLKHFGSIPTKVLMSKIKSLTASGCEIILLDHANMCVSGLNTDDERKDLDILYTELAAFRAAHPIHMIVVAHVDKKSGVQELTRPTEPKWNYINMYSLRGTAGMTQLSCNIILLHNELLPSGKRGRVMLGIPKNRSMGVLGDLDIVCTDYKSGMFIDSSNWVYDKESGYMVPPGKLNIGY